MNTVAKFTSVLFTVWMTGSALSQQTQGPVIVGAPVTPIKVTIKMAAMEQPVQAAADVTIAETTVPEGEPLPAAPPPPHQPIADPVFQKPLVKPGSKGVTQGGVGANAVSVPLVNVAGTTSPSNPPDVTGDVGPNHYIQMVNATTFQIFDKSGAQLTAPISFGSLWSPAKGNAGDPIVVYDQLADRWVLTQFFTTGMYFAISQTPDPTAGTWYLYEFTTGAGIPDYPKIGVWPDAFYMSSYEAPSLGVFAFDRVKMLAGLAAGFVKTTIPVLTGSPGIRDTRILPVDIDGPAPPPGTPGYFVRTVDDQQDTSNPTDRVEIYEAIVNWTGPTFSFPLVNTLTPAAFNTMVGNRNGGGVRDMIPQPNTTATVDSLSNRPMMQLKYRYFGATSKMVFCQTVDISGSIPALLGFTPAQEVAGIRWYQLDKSGANWTIDQQGTFGDQPPGATNESQLLHRWMGSVAMNGNGDIGLGYSICNDDDTSPVFPGIRYTGRVASDPVGTLPQGEGNIITGTASKGANGAFGQRWGDYAQMGVDPADDTTFWFTSHVASGATRIASFTLTLPPTQEIAVAQPVGNGLFDGASSSNFGVLQVGGSNTLTFTISNLGGTDLTGLSVSKNGADSADFTLGALGATTLATGATTTFTVTFSPGTLGLKNAAIHIASNDADENPFDIALVGTAAVQEIAVEQPASTGLTDATDTRDFGLLKLGNNAPLTFTIRNVGGPSLTGLSISKDGANSADFTVGSLGATTLGALASTTFTVTFAPSAAGARTAAIHIASNDADENPFDITLTGTGYDPQITVQQPEGSGLTDGVSTVAFGNVLAGANLTKRFSIKNNGAGPLTLSGASINGAHAADFALGTLSATQLAVGQTAYLDISFRPIFPNSKSAALHITSDDPDESPFDIALTGYGTTPGGPVLLGRDINITPNGLSPVLPVVIGTQEFFLGTTVDAGQELWRTDGTAAGTFMVKDIIVGTSGPGMSNLTNFNGTLFFTANNGSQGNELWKSDGTNAGTILMKDINTGVSSSSPANLTVIGSTLFFSANETANGTELWKSDGTTAGTVLVANIAAGATSSSPSNFRAVGSTLFFTANDAINGVELWKSDGTAGGTVLVKDIVAGITSSSPANLTAVGSALFFTVNDTVNGIELWTSDGTVAGTVLVKDINPGITSSSPSSLVEFGGALYFQATTATEGAELWKSDGTAAGTVMLMDIFSGVSSSSPTNFLNAGGTLYFSAFDANGREVWKTDGTSVGTVMVSDIFAGASSSNPSQLTLIDSVLYFNGAATGLGNELFKTDGTAVGTVMVKDISPGASSSSPLSLVNLGGTLLFAANDGIAGIELWKSDGTDLGTVMILDGQTGSSSSAPANLRNVNGTLYLSAFDGINGTELWKSDGTVPGTVLVKDIATGVTSSSPASFSNLGSTLYFSAFDSTNGTELWKSDGTSLGTVLVSNIATTSTSSSPTLLTAVGSTIFFSATDTTANGAELWKSDGTAAGTALVLNINPAANTGSSLSTLTDFNGTLFFSANDGTNGVELWKSDGTAAGTVLVKDINAGSVSSAPANLRVIGSTLFFTATTAANGTEVWKTDGTTAGTVMVSDIIVGASGSSPANLTVVGTTLFFSATTVASANELWKTDGTAVGTVMVKDINVGGLSSTPANMVAVGSTLFFSALNGTALNGNELWKSDGTAAGTVMVADIVSGTGSSTPQILANASGTVYFNAFATASGRELWKSDGSAAGTVLVTDILAGTASSSPINLTPAGSLLFFAATGPGLGSTELFVLDTAPPEEIQIEQPVGSILVDGVSTINIGSPALGGSAVSKTFTIKNIGTQTLTITGVTADGADSASFSFPTLVGTNIPAAGSAVLTVTLNPTSLGAKTAALHIESTDGDENPFDIALTGTVIALPEIQVEQPAGTIKLDGSSTVPFGDSALTVGVTKTFTISNVGSSSLNVTSITVDGVNSADFAPTAFSGTVPNGSSVAFNVTFTPSATGARAAVLHVNCDDADEASYDIMLIGIGSAPPGLLKLARDINQTGASPAITSMVLFGGSAYFAANTPDFGIELWKTDGTAAGTVMVKDIATGANSSSPANLSVIGGTLYFSATNITNGIELWKSDGTNAGTAMVKDIFTGITSSSPANLTNVGGTLFFSATDTTANGIELWKSDGTTAGTVMVLNINPTANTSSTPTLLTAVGSTLFFSATDTTLNGAELWKSDGTAAGTVLVKDINTTANTGSSLANLTVVGSTLFFSASEATNGTELWKSDGTAVGTVIVKDIFAGTTGSSPAVLVNVAGTLFFRATTTAAGTELWKSDGTTVGTLQVKDIFSGASSSTPASLFPVGPLVYFSATDGVNGTELWKSDGTSAGTVLVADINPGAVSSSPINFTLVGSTLYFAATTASGSTELWQTDGTATNTSLVLDINSGSGASSPGVMLNLGGSLIFVANDGSNGAEIWKSDGTGTSLVKDITPGTNSASPALLTLMNGVVYFQASDGVNGTELWRSDGTLAGSIMVKDIFPGSLSSGPSGLTVIGSTFYFSAFDSTNGTELWKSDGTAAGTVLVKDIFSGASSSNPTNLTNINGTLYFSANDGVNSFELWKSDGTDAGTVMVKDINPAGPSSSPSNITSFNGTVLFTANDGTNGTELWKSDGTAAGTVMVLDINAGASVSSSPSNLRVIGSTLFFTATTATNGVELWKSDGTAAGTVIVSDIIAGAISSSPANLTVIGSTLFFSASNGAAVNGTELWKSDGTLAGTVMVKDINTGTLSSSPANMLNVDGTLFFSALDAVNSVELWKSDGTTAGTVLVKDIAPGALVSSPGGLVNAYGTVYFRALTAAPGIELWKSDGTTTGTVMASDVRPGALSSTPSNLTVVGGNLFFNAVGPDLGTELWVYDLGLPREIVVEQPVGTGLIDGVSSSAFGNVNVGSSSVAKLFTITNLNTSVIDLTGIAVTKSGADMNQFTVDTTSMAASLAPGVSTTFTVTFSPTTSGAKSAALQIASNDLDENPFDISLSGSGVVPAEIAVFDGIAPPANERTDNVSTFGFGSVNTGSSSAAQTFTIQNLGSATANLTGLAVTSTNATEFTFTAPLAATLAPGATTTFTVTFSPSAASARTGVINIASNDGDENPFEINVVGTGTVPVPVTDTFGYTGGIQTFVVPPGVTSVTLETFGAQGRNNAAGVVGGLGGSSTGKLAVTPGQTLYIHVGGGGTTGTTGGFNGGGNAGTSPSTGSLGGGGGGASDVRAGGTGLNNRVIVAGGGGGAGGNRVATLGRGTGGGGGGGYYGGGGGSGWPGVSPGPLPTGGTQIAGGTGGDSTWPSVPGNDGLPGVLGTGGAGGVEEASNQSGSQAGSSGGVGGGLTGSDGSYPGNFAGQSGAGGSSYLGGVTEGVTLSGVQSGNGLVKITYGRSAPGLVFTGLPITTQGTNYQAGGNDLPTREMNFTPTPGQSYPYIEVTGAANDIIGFFNDLPDGGVVAMNFNGVIYYFQVNYNGGVDGNDLIFTNLLNPGPANWKWTAGPDARNAVAIFGAEDVGADANNPGARQGAMNWRAPNGSLWMFGGYGYATTLTRRPNYLNDLWEYDRVTGRWIWHSGAQIQNQLGTYGSITVSAAANTPGSRHTGTTWTDSSGNLWLFGGLGYGASGGRGRLNDLWRFSISTGQWTWMKGSNATGAAGVYSGGAATLTPGARQGATGWAAPGGNLYLFGGTTDGGSTFHNDLWLYTTGTGNWTLVKGNGTTNLNGTYGTQGTGAVANTPGARRDATGWVAKDGTLWLFGGRGLAETGATLGDMSDLWSFNTTTSNWTHVSGPKTQGGAGTYTALGSPGTPAARSAGSGWVTVDGDFWLVGGFKNSKDCYSDVWIYDIGSNTWTWKLGSSSLNVSGTYGTLGVAAPGNQPGARYTPSTWVTLNGAIWVFGGGGFDGRGSGGRVSDLWRYGIATPAGAPPEPSAAPFPDSLIVNDAPNASDAAAGTMAYVPVTGQLSGSDADGDNILFLSSSPTALSQGTLSLNPDGTWSYTPAPGFVGQSTFQFRAADAYGGSSPVRTLVITVVTNPADSDNDGIADAYEQTYLGGTGADALGDADLDGQNNYFEYLAGTSPVDAAQSLSTAPSIAAGASDKGGSFKLDLNHVRPGVNYHLETSTDLDVWNRIGTFTFSVSGSATIEDPTPPTGQPQFYRVSLDTSVLLP